MEAVDGDMDMNMTVAGLWDGEQHDILMPDWVSNNNEI